MADWSLPTLTSTYTNFLSQLQTRDTDLALQFDGTTTSNQPTGTIRWDSSAGRWKKWTGSAWGELAATYALTGLSTTGNASIGGTLGVTGATTLATATATTPATADNSTNIATTAFVKAQAYAPLASPTLTGTPAAPTAATSTNTTQIATTAFTVAQIANDALLKTGGTLTGALTLAADPIADLQPATKRWVEALAPKQSCRVATTAALTVTATTSTLTNSGTLAAISIDGVSLSSGDRVLVKDQATTAQNGIYTVTTVGSGAIAWVLTRASDGDVWNDLIGATVPIAQGTANDNTYWLSTTTLGGTLGTTAITWQLISNAQVAAFGSLASFGMVALTAAGTVTNRSVAVSGTGLSVTNPDGVSGNPTIASNATNANTASTVVARDASGNFSAGTLTLTGLSYSGNIDSSSTGYLDLPAGTTAQRPASPNSGMIRYNSDTGQFEGYGTAWSGIGGGAKGGGSDQVFFENDQTVSTSYSITSGKNAVTAGPVTVASGITVTIPSGSYWSVV
jgi:hypothetical protein